MDEQDVDAVAPEQPQAFLDGPAQPVLVLRIERLGAPAELGREVAAACGVGERVAEHLLAVEVAGRGVGVVDPELERAVDRTARVLAVLGADARDEQSAHAEDAHLESGPPERSLLHRS